MGADPVRAYLGRYAQPETEGIVAGLDRHYHATVVVVARGESPEMIRRLAPALHQRQALGIVVVNGDRDDPPAVAQSNARLLDELGRVGEHVEDVAAGVTLVRAPHMELLVVDHASPDRWLPVGRGVGLARRIGCDIALGLWHRGRVERRFLDSTDADATLPADYFDHDPKDAVALARPFVHTASDDPAVDRATALYEMTLRYYVAGLRHARSPWAMHTIGSCLSVAAPAYAAVRGVPIRTAGEDFYLLAKVAKLGRVAIGSGSPIRIQSRMSQRVPFGTGPGAAAIAATLRAGQTPRVYDPASFTALKTLSDALARWCASPVDDPATAFARDHADCPALVAAVHELGVWPSLARAIRGTTTERQRSRRRHEWFDAFRTLKLIHGLRAHGHAPVPWPQAVAQLLDQPVSTDEAAVLEQLRTLDAASTDAGMPPA